MVDDLLKTIGELFQNTDKKVSAIEMKNVRTNKDGFSNKITIVQMFRHMSWTEAINHGDFHFWNTLINREGELFVLDWEKAMIADPRFDIANTLILGYSWFGTSFKEPMLDAYQNSTKKELEHLNCFEALVSLDSLTKVIPIIHGADDSHIRDRSFQWLKRRYELFTVHNGVRVTEVERYLESKGLL
ncbi:phosphotransferase family protein [Alkalihalobacillus pseudalcaliphilus]|uniref:phosphotransferase family protein n=1 Tax=Alkalihalobacillus pseudalcaliphilus TaxID=79884 RepID=UPI00064E0436|nr:aminoglycoside phosphotransferase family protein [Alkalihalobacillus pseudalcaliphilus]KMK77519.1 hypothetical protein AB990_03350 [Alkalihalobacillus pseudalcaliphilus]